MRHSTERGIALITTLMVMALISALLAGFTTLVISDQRYRFIDRDRSQSFYAASGAIEKMTADLGNLFLVNVAPLKDDIVALTGTAKKPTIAGVSYAASSVPVALPASQLTSYHCKGGGTMPVKTPTTVGTPGYTIMYCADPIGRPTVSDDPVTIKAGPYDGLVGLQTPYQLDVTARTAAGGETHLIRTVEAVAIPVFQFGIFSDSDLSFFAREDFGFGGRIHTNGNLFLAEGTGQTLTTNDKITAVKDVVRQRLSNGVTIDDVAMEGTVRLASSSTGWRNLGAAEGSVQQGPGSAATANWGTISQTNYNYWLRNSATGAKKLELPMVATAVGGKNIDLVRRPPAGESATSLLFGERMFSKASIRILLSDTPDDITTLPSVTSTAPVYLDGDWNTAFVAGTGGRPSGYGAGGTTIDAAHPPVALSPGVAFTSLSTGSTTTQVNVGSTLAFRPVITVVGTTATARITCTGKTSNTFTGCTAVSPATQIPAAAVGAAIKGAEGYQTTLATAIVAAAGPMTITVQANGTNNFVPPPFWITYNAANGGPRLVNCTAWTATAFTGCTGMTTAPSSSNTISAGSNAVNNGLLSAAGTGLLGGYLKIEVQNAGGVWTDVTTQILNYGVAGPNQFGAACAGNTDAIVRLQRWRDFGGSGTCAATLTTGAKDPTNYWPLALFDTREAALRDLDPAIDPNVTLGGVMYYIALDVKNLAKWFKGQGVYAGGSGTTARIDNTGYTVYFSDRRNNRNASNLETGEYGWEDFVNPGVTNGLPNDGLDAPGEDVNENTTFESYGMYPNYNGAYNTAPPGATAPLTTSARPTTQLTPAQAQVNRPILFRRALKLINGSALNNTPTPSAERIAGLTVVSENPVYIEGNWNAYDAASFAVTAPHAATAMIADAVTVLSSAWLDRTSFNNPYTASSATAGANRPRATDSWYRVAILGGKGPAFAKPGDISGSATVFGTDGGAHNFLRMLEGDSVTSSGGQTTVHYRGSMATLFYSRQAVGTFKCCSGTFADGIVYSVPVRDFWFDTDFLIPGSLPPNTPMFRDMNAVGFSQELRPGK